MLGVIYTPCKCDVFSSLVDAYPLCLVLTFYRMKRKFYSWEECMNLREVKVRMVMLWAGYGTLYSCRDCISFLGKIMLCDLSNNAQQLLESCCNSCPAFFVYLYI